MPSIARPRSKAAQRIMDAAQELFVGIGFEATKMEHIARNAGVSRQTVYQYSLSKGEIYRLVLSRAAQRYREALDRVDQQQDPRKVLADIISAMLDEYIGSAHLLLIDVALHEQIIPPPIVRKTALAYRDAIGRALARGQEQGVFHARASAEVFQAHAISLLAGFSLSRRTLPVFTDVDCVSAKALAFWKNYLTAALMMMVETDAPDRKKSDQCNEFMVWFGPYSQELQ